MAQQAMKKLQLRWANLTVVYSALRKGYCLGLCEVLLGPFCAHEMFLLLLLTLIPDLPKIFLLVSVQVSAVAVTKGAVTKVIESPVKCFSMETVQWV